MSSEADDKAFRLYRVRLTAAKMLKNRGYNIDESETKLTFEGFKERFGEQVNTAMLMIKAQHIRDQDDKIAVYITDTDKKASAKDVATIAELSKEAKAKRIILVTRMGVTSMGAKATTLGIHIELFKQEDLLVDITEHELVPQHVILSEEEKQALLLRYRLKESQLPRILRSDPVAKYFGVIKGQVLKIVRPSETAGQYVTYRIVE